MDFVRKAASGLSFQLCPYVLRAKHARATGRVVPVHAFLALRVAEWGWADGGGHGGWKPIACCINEFGQQRCFVHAGPILQVWCHASRAPQPAASPCRRVLQAGQLRRQGLVSQLFGGAAGAAQTGGEESPGAAAPASRVGDAIVAAAALGSAVHDSGLGSTAKAAASATAERVGSGDGGGVGTLASNKSGAASGVQTLASAAAERAAGGEGPGGSGLAGTKGAAASSKAQAAASQPLRPRKLWNLPQVDPWAGPEKVGALAPRHLLIGGVAMPAPARASPDSAALSRGHLPAGQRLPPVPAELLAPLKHEQQAQSALARLLPPLRLKVSGAQLAAAVRVGEVVSDALEKHAAEPQQQRPLKHRTSLLRTVPVCVRVRGVPICMRTRAFCA